MRKFILPFCLAISSLAYAAVRENSAQQHPLPSAQEEMNGAMYPMCKNMDSMKTTGSIEHDFIYKMIPHHQSVLEMVGTNPEIRATAEKIIEAQTKEIAELELWLKELPLDMTNQPRK